MNKKFIDLINNKNYVITGRASSAIYSIIKVSNIIDSLIMVPANICYAAVYPIIYSGNKPYFIDIDSDDGNINYKIVKANYNKTVKAIIIPHMYGNPVQEIEKICEFCKKNDVLVIEDCASSMGATINNRITGDFGDYSIFSFGYSKILDLGNGGMVISNRNLENLKKSQEELPFYTIQIEEKLNFFSKMYRVIRNSNENEFIQKIYCEIPNYYKDAFLYKSDKKINDKIIKNIGKLEDIIDLRKKNSYVYKENIHKNSYIMEYKMHEGAVPWRFNLLIKKDKRDDFIAYLLEHKVPVSDWYPSVTKMFNQHCKLNNVDKMEKMIINFPVILDKEKILNICDIVNNYFYLK